ncbi:MAG: ribosome silencing factor [Desulfovibrio sp.]|jgi:ribosome-associated protein|nr:ribosome silencing factor [Desulfovibrio sp.]
MSTAQLKLKSKFFPVSVRDKVAAVVRRLHDKKGVDIVALDLVRENTLYDAVVICGARSVRHGQGMADYLLNSAPEDGLEYLRMEGHALGSWILLDFNEVVVHIFQAESRGAIRLEDMWPKAPVSADTGKEKG